MDRKDAVEAKGTPILSPMVGTFYAAPSPEAEPFVEVGKTIAEGDVVCIVESLNVVVYMYCACHKERRV